MKKEAILEMFPEEELIFVDGMDDAIIGISTNDYRVVYSVGKCIDNLKVEDGMDEMEAIEHFEYNIASAYIGEKTPIYAYDEFY